MKLRHFLAVLAVLLLAAPAHSATNAQSIDFLLSQVRASGTVLAGGKVYFYSAGTTTPKTVWLNRSKQTTAANPYTLDGNGTAQLFGDGVYRIVIKDSAGVTKYDRDNLEFKTAKDLPFYDANDLGGLTAAVGIIATTPATLVYNTTQTVGTLTIPANINLQPMNGADIAVTTGNTLTVNGPSTDLSVTGAGTVAVNGAMDGTPKFRNTGGVSGLYEAKGDWFGTLGNGDDQVEINKAIAALVTDGTLYISPTTHTINGEVAVNKRIHVINRGTLKIKDNSSAGAVATHGILTITASGATVEGGIYDGNMANQSWDWAGSSNYGISVLNGADNATVRDVEVKNVTGNGVGAAVTAKGSIWVNVYSHHNGKKGFHSGPGSATPVSEKTVEGIVIVGGEYSYNENDSGIGIHQGAYNVSITDARAHHNHTYGIHMGESLEVATSIGNTTVTGCKIYDNGIDEDGEIRYTNVYISRFWDAGGASEDTIEQNAILTGNQIYYTIQGDASGGSQGENQFNIQSWNSKNVQIKNNVIKNGGILVYNGVNNDISSNQFISNFSALQDYLILLRGSNVTGSHASHLETLYTRINNNLFEVSNVVNVVDTLATKYSEVKGNTWRTFGGVTHNVRIRDTDGVNTSTIDQRNGTVTLISTTYTDGYITGQDRGAGAPTSTPLRIGDTYLNTSTSKWYKATCTTSAACWAILN